MSSILSNVIGRYSTFHLSSPAWEPSDTIKPVRVRRLPDLTRWCLRASLPIK